MKMRFIHHLRAIRWLAISMAAIPALFLGVLAPVDLHAQPQITPEQLTNLPPVDPSQIPAFATFWEWFYGRNGQGVAAPLPTNPYGPEVPVYALGNGQYFINNGPDDLNLFQQQQLESQMSLASPITASDTTSAQADNSPQFTSSFPPGTFYICSIAVTGQVINLVLTNTVQDVTYEILSKDSLTNTADWISEGTVLGLSNSTPATVWMGYRTNQLFLWARSWADTSGSGIPDWWMTQYFGNDRSTWPLAYTDYGGDGYTLHQLYELDWNPWIPRTPMPPQNVAATLDSTGTNVIVTWASGGGPVSQYAIEDEQGGEYQRVSNSTFSYTNSLSNALSPGYRVRAYFTDGTSAVSSSVFIEDPALSITGGLARGPGFQVYLIISPVPQSASIIRLTSFANYPPIDIPVSNFQNGILLLTNWALLSSQAYRRAQAISVSGAFGFAIPLWEENNPTTVELWDWRVFPGYSVPAPEDVFVNASHHMKENLRFLLRSAMVTWPFGYISNRKTDGTVDDPWDFQSSPESFYVRPPGNGDYECYGFHVYSPDLGWSILDEMRPVQENFLWTNFVLSVNWTSLAWWDDGDRLHVVDTPNQPFQPAGNDTTPPLAFTLSADDAWSYALDPSVASETEQIGLSLDSNLNGTVLPNIVNNYGLPLRSIATWGGAGGDEILVLHPGDNSPIGPECFTDFAAPNLRITNYYFASQTPYLTKDLWVTSWPDGLISYNGPLMPIPGSPGFSPTNTSPLLITGVGQPITVSAWAKMAIDNGYVGKFGYLEQYLEQALAVDQNGKVTTNQAGVVSPYGGFFPTTAGPAAIVTMPDIDTGQRGTGVVNVIKLQLDVNHDGKMDLSFGGPDNTSSWNPFVFWVNNDFDRLALDPDDNVSYEDSVEVPKQPGWKGWLLGWTLPPDADNRDTNGRRVIPTVRDLEDFARLWICGVTTNVLAALPPGSTVTLDWGDVGNPNLNNPTIDLFQAADPDGGTGYLTNAVTGMLQTNTATSQYVGRLGPGQRLQLTGSQFAGGWAGNYLVWCGVGGGNGQLTLTISQSDTNTLAQTSAYIQLLDIKQMYERWTVGEYPSETPTNHATLVRADLPPGIRAFQYSSSTDTNTPYILFVHGWNMDPYMKDRFAETAFKRLYWQGYQGRFGSFRWPTDYGFAGDPLESWSNPLTDRRNFDNSEFNAWQSALGLENLLAALNHQYPGHVYLLAHSMGNIVAGQALLFAGSRQVNTYVASQAAISAHVYDSTVTNTLFDTSSPRTPNIYKNLLIANSGGAGRRVNFYNANDYALAKSRWGLDQVLKPDDSPTTLSWAYAFYGYPYYYSGYPVYTSGSIDDTPPWRQFLKYRVDKTVYFDLSGPEIAQFEVMAYAAQARATALGATPIATFPNIDLTDPDNQVWPSPDPLGKNYASHFWHSAQFRAAYAEQQGYWKKLLSVDGFGVK